MMGFAEDKFMDYLQSNFRRLETIKIDELLPHLTDCLSMYSVEKLNTYVRNQGNMASVIDFYLSLRGRDNWVKCLIDALKRCGHSELAEEFEGVYSSYQLPTPRQSFRSLDTQPGPSSKPSQRFNQIQPEQETIRTPPSQQNHEFRSLPPFRPDYPAPPRAQLSHEVSAPMHSDESRLEEDTSRNPVPESTPYHTASSEGDVKAIRMETSISENPYIGPDPLSSCSLSPSFKHPQSEISIKPSSENVSLAKVLETSTAPSYSPSISSEEGANNQRGQPVYDKAERLPEQVPVFRTVNTGQKGPEGGEEQRVQPISRRDEDVSDSHPVRYTPANRETAQEDPGRERPANPQVVSGSSCRPLGNHSDEEYASKPGMLVSTLGLGEVTTYGVSSVLSHIPELEISDTEGNESINISDRSSTSIIRDNDRSSTSNTRDNIPSASTPNTQGMQSGDRRQPEESDFLFDSKSSPRRLRPLDHSSSKQPEENSFESGAFSHYRLHFSEGPEEDLMKGNDDVLRNRPRKIPNTIEPNDESTQPNYSEKSKGRDLERKALITITVASVCISLYLLWKSRQT